MNGVSVVLCGVWVVCMQVLGAKVKDITQRQTQIFIVGSAFWRFGWGVGPAICPGKKEEGQESGSPKGQFFQFFSMTMSTI